MILHGTPGPAITILAAWLLLRAPEGAPGRRNRVTHARVWFVGVARGARPSDGPRSGAIAEADIVIWGCEPGDGGGGSRHAAPDAELIPWPPAKMEEILAAYDRAGRRTS